MYAFEEAGQIVELTVNGFAHHVSVEKCGHGSAGGMTSDEQTAIRTRRVFLDQHFETLRNRFHHFTCDVEEACMTEVRRVIKETLWACWR